MAGQAVAAAADYPGQDTCLGCHEDQGASAKSGAHARAFSPMTPNATMGTMDVGFRATSTSGDEARYELYRDLRDGLFTNIVFGKQTDASLFDVTAKDIGYHE